MRLVSAPRLDTKTFLPAVICAGTGAAGGNTGGGFTWSVAGSLEFISVSNCCAQPPEADNDAADRVRNNAIQNLLTFPITFSDPKEISKARLRGLVLIHWTSHGC